MHLETGEAGPTAGSWSASVRQCLEVLSRAPDDEARLLAVARLARYAEHLTAEVVAQARAAEEPLSWARIGAALGMSRQAAHERFAPVGQEGALQRRYRRARRLDALREERDNPVRTPSMG